MNFVGTTYINIYIHININFYKSGLKPKTNEQSHKGHKEVIWGKNIQMTSKHNKNYLQ